MKIHVLFLFLLAMSTLVPAWSATRLFVSEYGTGNLRSFDPSSGASNALPAHYTPVGGNTSGADGMVTDAQGRLYVNRGDGTIYRRSLNGSSFTMFADLNVDFLLDLTRNDTHLFAAQFGENVIHRIALADAATSTIAGPPGTDRFDGVRIGPDGRLYAVESADGGIYAYDLTNTTWSTFLAPDNAGDASQLAFGSDGRVFLSRTISGQARIYSYALTTSGIYTSGLNPASQTLIGTFGNTTATGIRIGPDNRLYANAFGAGQVWRSNVGITAMEGTPFLTGLNEPGSLFFEIDPAPPAATNVLVVGAPVAERELHVHYTYQHPDQEPEGATIVRWYFDQPPFTNMYASYVWGTNRSVPLAYNPGPWHVRAAVFPVAENGLTGTVAYSDWIGPILASDALAVFHIGNSFTRWGHIPLQLQHLAIDAGFSHTFGEQLADGQGLGYHWTNGLAGGVLTRGTPARLELVTGGWDWLVLQPMSREWQPANLPALVDFASRFAALAQSNNTRIALYHYWNFLDEGAAEQDAINAAFETVRAALASNGIDAVIIPAGDAFTNAVAAIPSLDRPELYQDNLHPTDIGYYLSALTHFATLYRQSPLGLTNGAISADVNLDDPVAIDPSLAAALQQVAWDSARYHPRSGVTRSRFDAWAAALPAGQRDWLDDPFTNGLPNLLRWAYGISPLIADEPVRHLRIDASTGQVDIRYDVGADAEDAGVRIVEQQSSNLVTWTDGIPTGLAATRTNQQVRISGDATETNGFLRLLIRHP